MSSISRQEAPSSATSHAGPPRLSDLLPYDDWLPEHRLFVLDRKKAGKGCDEPENRMPRSVGALGFVLETSFVGDTGDLADHLAAILQGCPAGAAVQFCAFGGGPLDRYLGYCAQPHLVNNASAAPAECPPAQATAISVTEARAAAYMWRGEGPCIPRLGSMRLVIAVTLPAIHEYDHVAIEHADRVRTSLRNCVAGKIWDWNDLVEWNRQLLNPHRRLLPESAAPEVVQRGPCLKQEMVDEDTVLRINNPVLSFGTQTKPNACTVSVYSVVRYPRSCSLRQMAAVLGAADSGGSSYSSPFLITMGVFIGDVVKDRERVRQRAVESSVLARTAPTEKNESRAQEWKSVRNVVEGGHGIVKLYHQLLLFSEAGAAGLDADAALGVWRDAGFTLVEDSYFPIHGYLRALPLTLTPAMQSDIAKLQAFSTKTLGNAVNLAPIDRYWPGTGQPAFPLWTRRGNPFTLDLSCNPCGNFNAAVIGHAGASRARFLKEIILGHVARGDAMWIIDAHGSYTSLAALLGGMIVDDPWEIFFDPFQHDCDDIIDACDIILPPLEQMVFPEGNPTDYARCLFRAVVSAFLTEHRESEPTLIRFVAYLGEGVTPVRGHIQADDANRVDVLLKDWQARLQHHLDDVRFGQCLTRPQPRENHQPRGLIVFDMRALEGDPAALSLAAAMVCRQVLDAMYLLRNGFKLLLIDHADDLLPPSGSAGVLLRRTRRYWGSVVCGIAFKGGKGKAQRQHILDNTSWKIVLPEETGVPPDSWQEFARTTAQRAMVQSLNRVPGCHTEAYVRLEGVGHEIVRMYDDPIVEPLFATAVAGSRSMPRTLWERDAQ